jgi:hypothetical protein
MNRHLGSRVFLHLATVLFCAASAHADVVTLSVTSDTFIAGSGPDALEGNNGGADTLLTAGQDLHGNIHRALFQFDLSSIPSGSIVTSVVFSETTQPATRSFSATFGLFAIQAEWVEGTGGGGPKGSAAASGEVNWNDRMLGVASWTNPGGDFDATALADTLVDSFATFQWSGSGLLATVQGWIGNPSGNHGLLLKDEAESGGSIFHFGSREGGSPATLTIGYTLPAPPPPPQVTAISIATNRVRLLWSNNSGKKYDVLLATNLLGTQTWIPAETNIPAHISGTNEWFDPATVAPSATIRFYGVAEKPGP